MKNFLFITALSVSMLLSSCMVYKPTYVADVAQIDYSGYMKTGFFLTESNSVNFEYTPVGSVVSYVSSGYTGKEKITVKEYDDVYGETTRTVSKNQWVEASVYDAIDMAVEKAKSQGANGIINLNITSSSWVENGKTVLSYQVSGMSIKR